MQEATEKTHPNMQAGGKFVDTLIVQWMKQAESNISQQQMEEQAVEKPNTQEANERQVLHNQEHVLQELRRKLKESQKAEASLSTCLEVELHNKEEIRAKLDSTWETIETINEYFNYISESLASIQQHRANLSSLYDNVILKQQEAIQRLQSNDTKMKDLETEVMHLQNESLLLEKRLQEATAENDKSQKQLKDSECKIELQKKQLTNTYAQKKLKLVKEYDSRLQTIEKEKGDIAKLAAQLENKLEVQEERVQTMLAEQNRWQTRVKDTENEFYSEKNALVMAQTEEKKILAEKQQQLQSEYEGLQLQLKMLEQNKSDITEMIAQKDVLLSKVQNENSAYKNQMEVMTTNSNEIYIKYEALMDKLNMYEKELDAKSGKIQDLEATASAIKQKESSLINDVNRIEKKLISETDYSKNLESKFLNTQKELRFAQERIDEMQKTLEKMKTMTELDSIKLQQQLKGLQKEKEEIIKRENIRIKNAEILYENMQVKREKEMLALKSNHEMQLLELNKTIDHLNEITNDMRKENDILNMTLTEVKTDNSNWKDNYGLLVELNEELQTRLCETLEMRSIEDRKQFKDKLETKEQKQQPIAPSKNQRKKRKYEIRFDPDITEIPEAGHCNVSTSAELIDDADNKQPSSQSSIKACSTEKESQKEQEAEVTSAGRKFFKSRPVQPRTYYKRRQNL